MKRQRRIFRAPAMGSSLTNSANSDAQGRARGGQVSLQGKIILCFAVLLGLCVTGSCWMFVTQSERRLVDMMGEQARQLACTLALASKDELRGGRVPELSRMAQDLIKSRNIVFAGFLDTNFKLITLASRDQDWSLQEANAGGPRTAQMLLQPCPGSSRVFGDYLEVVAPVLSTPIVMLGSGEDSAHAVEPRLLGYVTVGVSQAAEQAQLRVTNYAVLGIGCVLVIISVPLGYALVHRVLQPIRQLVGATQRIAAGDLNTRVAIHRPDVIGTLARSFNEMVMQVKRHHEELEDKVRQRTAELETANKRLSREISEKDDFLRAVSHDLGAPLRNISGMASMLLLKNRAQFDDEIIRRLERIQKNVQTETDLIAELLELSRIKSRRQKIERVEIDAMIRELRDLFESDLRSREIELTIDTPLPALNCERARIRQVFQNLIDNAIKYMGGDEREVREVHVGCQRSAADAQFYVRDTGIGIGAEELDKVFCVFRRGRNAATQNVPGKGVGLASVKSIIETYNGSIWVESQVGQGSTFKFTISGAFVAGEEPSPGPEPMLLAS